MEGIIFVERHKSGQSYPFLNERAVKILGKFFGEKLHKWKICATFAPVKPTHGGISSAG